MVVDCYCDVAFGDCKLALCARCYCVVCVSSKCRSNCVVAYVYVGNCYKVVAYCQDDLCLVGGVNCTIYCYLDCVIQGWCLTVVNLCAVANYYVDILFGDGVVGTLYCVGVVGCVGNTTCNCVVTNVCTCIGHLEGNCAFGQCIKYTFAIVDCVGNGSQINGIAIVDFCLVGCNLNNNWTSRDCILAVCKHNVVVVV